MRSLCRPTAARSRSPAANRRAASRSCSCEGSTSSRRFPSRVRNAPSTPFYSPDGQWIGFGAGRRLLKVNLRAGTAPVSLCECAPQGLDNGVAWLENGSIVFTRADSGLQRIAAEGGEPSALTALAANEFDHHNPAPLPGGRSLLFTSHRKDGTFAIEAVTLDGGARTVIAESAYDAHYLSSGHLIYGRPGAILAVPFDADRLSPTGAAVTLVEGVSGDASSGRGGFQLSANGSLIYRAAPSLEGRVLTWVTRDGLESPLPLSPRAFSSPEVSPDGTRLAFAVAEAGRRDIWIYEVSSQRLVRLTREGDNKTPLWSRDGRRLVYSSTRDGGPKLWVQPADGSAAPQAMVTGEDIIVPGSWSPDDEAIVFVHEKNNSAAGSRSAVVPASGGGEPRQLFTDDDPWSGGVARRALDRLHRHRLAIRRSERRGVPEAWGATSGQRRRRPPAPLASRRPRAGLPFRPADVRGCGRSLRWVPIVGAGPAFRAPLCRGRPRRDGPRLRLGAGRPVPDDQAGPGGAAHEQRQRGGELDRGSKAARTAWPVTGRSPG